MTQRRRAGWAAGGLSVCLSLSAGAAPPETAWLISEADAAALRLSAEARPSPNPLDSLRAAMGPRIELHLPTLTAGGALAETGSDLALVAEFIKTQAEVDMDTLDIELRNGGAVKSLTDKLRPYLRGQRLDAHHLYMPPGRFELFITIEDRQGHPTQKNYLWLVKAAGR